MSVLSSAPTIAPDAIRHLAGEVIQVCCNGSTRFFLPDDDLGLLLSGPTLRLLLGGEFA
jgi:hypothetical protein